MPLLKMLKLLYLAERRALALHAEPIIGDRPVSMWHGPALSRTYDQMIGAVHSVKGEWKAWISDREGEKLALRDAAALHSPEDQLLALSDSDAEILDEVSRQFGEMSQWQLVKHTREHCPEWRDPGDAMFPIELRDLFLALGYEPNAAAEAVSSQECRAAVEAAIIGARQFPTMPWVARDLRGERR